MNSAVRRHTKDALTVFPVNLSMVKVWRRNFLSFKKAMLPTLFWIAFEPIFFLLALGFGVGQLVESVQGVTYAQFFFPALLAITSMMVSFIEGTHEVHSKFEKSKVFETALLGPITAPEIGYGELFWIATKSCFGVLVILAFSGLLDLSTLKTGPLLMAVIFLNSWIFAAFGMGLSTTVTSQETFSYSLSGFIVPSALLSGTYFPIEKLPSVFPIILQAFPFTHTVKIMRALYLEKWDNLLWVSLLFLMVTAFLVTNWAISRFQRRLSS